MESKSVTWEIEYRVVETGKVQTMKIDLHFNKQKNIAKWFKMTHDGKNGKSNCEFLNAKILE
jgi:hypothetical protein